MQAPPEMLGAFYLGAEYDLKTGRRLPVPVNYDARDLTTHAICVGMTGSGKTGLCIDLLEEAAIDRVPAIIIDPKGDVTNLLLHFPELRPQDFRPWVNPDDARRRNMTLDAYAESVADQWRQGLADWGQGPERIRLLQESVNYTVYTPGSDAGLPISILSSLAAPGLDFDLHAEILRERISSTVVALLALVGIEADPVRSREAILLSNIFEHFWRRSQDLDLTRLILAVQTPPMRRLGVFDVDTFYPQKDRFALAMAFNNLMAAPTFQSWLGGDPLDIDGLLYTETGQPRHTIFYIAHLSESERMFFVTLLLEALVTWMRRQTGTTSLRALLYFDEIFGFFPPVKEPPSKRPLLTLLKQARAFGLGCVLVSQNPVDIDYKGLTNAGTWFIGRLQAERDKLRVLQGLAEAVAESGQRTAVDYGSLIGQLGNRVFLMHNVHEDGPVIFHTRWTMSYLRGPLTRPQVRQLMAEHRPAAAQVLQVRPAPTPVIPAPPPVAPPPAASPVPPRPAASSVPDGFMATPPALEPTLDQVYLPLKLGEQAAANWLIGEIGPRTEVQTVQLIYEPAIVAAASVRFADRRRQIDEQVEKLFLAPPPQGVAGVDWTRAESLPIVLQDLERDTVRVSAQQGPYFAAPPEAANSSQELKGLARDFSDWLYYNMRMPIQVHADLGIFQRPGERERAFRIRLQDAARARRDQEVDALRRKHEAGIARLRDRLRRYERDLIAEEAEYEARRREEYIGLGETLLGLFTGRRTGRAFSVAARKRRLSSQARLNMEQTRQEIRESEEQIEELEEELTTAANAITRRWADLLDDLTTEELTPRRTDINVQLVALAWVPSWLVTYDDGIQSRVAAIAAYPLPEGGRYRSPEKFLPVKRKT